MTGIIDFSVKKSFISTGVVLYPMPSDFETMSFHDLFLMLINVLLLAIQFSLSKSGFTD